MIEGRDDEVGAGDEGQAPTLATYALMFGLIAVVAITALLLLGGQVSHVLSNVSTPV